jgi:hypothetical protein
MKPQSNDAAKPGNRENANLKPGSPPRPATEPAGGKSSTRNSKTLTDPGSGEPQR